MKRKLLGTALVVAGALATIGVSQAQAETLRLLTWGGYAPDEVVALFTAETGIDVEVTLSNNEEMISKLRYSTMSAISRTFSKLLVTRYCLARAHRTDDPVTKGEIR